MIVSQGSGRIVPPQGVVGSCEAVDVVGGVVVVLLVRVRHRAGGLEEVRGLLADGAAGGHGEGGGRRREVGRLEVSHDVVAGWLAGTCALYCHYQH